jgi:hypothetical protein
VATRSVVIRKKLVTETRGLGAFAASDDRAFRNRQRERVRVGLELRIFCDFSDGATYVADRICPTLTSMMDFLLTLLHLGVTTATLWRPGGV